MGMTRDDDSTAPATAAAHAVDDFGALDPAWEGIRAEWVELAGARARLLRCDGDPDGPLVLLAHGLGGAATNWLEVMRPLARIGDVVAVDLMGFGETAPPRSDSSRPRANARFLATLLHHLDAAPAVVVGNSMGGLVAMLLAAEHPDLVRELVLLCPALPPWVPRLRLSRYQVTQFGPILVPVLGPMIMRRRMRRMSFEEQYRSGMAGLFADFDQVPDRVVEVGTANLARLQELRWRGGAFRAAVSGILERQMGPLRAETVRAMEQVAAPTLYVLGADDPLVLDATTSMVERTCPDWVVEVPAGIGHVPMIEDPAWTADRIERFVRGATVAQLRPA